MLYYLQLQKKADFLVVTYPQAYKDKGLEKVCVSPYGKYFKIFTPRNYYLLTRAFYSDKVHASLVRCI